MTTPLTPQRLAEILETGRTAARAKLAGGTFPAALGQAIADEIADVVLDAAQPLLLAEIARLTAEVAGARAAGYQSAADNAAECVRTHGSDADAEMLLVFLRRGAELRTDFAAALARQAAEITPPIDGEHCD